MKQQLLLKEIGRSVLYSLAALAIYPVFTWVFDPRFGAKLTIILAAACYLTHLVFLYHRRSGGLVLWTLANCCLIALLFFMVSIDSVLVAAVAATWALRCYLSYTKVFYCVIDLAVCTLSVGFGLWAFTVTTNLVIGLWCCLLVQSLAVLIPKPLAKHKHDHYHSTTESVFARAQQTAEAALGKMQ